MWGGCSLAEAAFMEVTGDGSRGGMYLHLWINAQFWYFSASLWRMKFSPGWRVYEVFTLLKHPWAIAKNPASFQEFHLDSKEFGCVTLAWRGPVAPPSAPCPAGCHSPAAKAGLSSVMVCCSSPSTHLPSPLPYSWRLQSSGEGYQGVDWTVPAFCQPAQLLCVGPSCIPWNWQRSEEDDGGISHYRVLSSTSKQPKLLPTEQWFIASKQSFFSSLLQKVQALERGCSLPRPFLPLLCGWEDGCDQGGRFSF